jgi:hypothetical protein
MLSRRSAKRAIARCAEDGRSIPLFRGLPFQQGDPSTVLRIRLASLTHAPAARDDTSAPRVCSTYNPRFSE